MRHGLEATRRRSSHQASRGDGKLAFVDGHAGSNAGGMADKRSATMAERRINSLQNNRHHGLLRTPLAAASVPNCSSGMLPLCQISVSSIHTPAIRWTNAMIAFRVIGSFTWVKASNSRHPSALAANCAISFKSSERVWAAWASSRDPG